MAPSEPAVEEGAHVSPEDWAQLCDELLALEAIHGEAFRFLGSQDVPQSTPVAELAAHAPKPGLEIRLEVIPDIPEDTPIGIALTAAPVARKDSSHADSTWRGREQATAEAGSSAGAGSSTEAMVLSPKGRKNGPTVAVKHLPPVEAFVRFPPGYPSSAPPSAEVWLAWGRPGAGEKAEGALRELWGEGGGTAVVHEWVQWIKENALVIAGASLGREVTVQVLLTEDEDPRDVLADLMTYSIEREEEEFAAKTHTCDLCGTDKPGTEFLRLPECSHAYCRACMAAMCSLHVREGGISMLRCPHHECRMPLPHYVLKDLLSDEEFARWDALVLKRYLEGNGDIKYCPRCDTPAIIEPGRAGGAELGQCPKCMHVFCSRCRLGDHRGETCAQALMREGAEVEERLERELQELIAKEKQDAERAAELRRKLSEQKAEKDFKRYLEEAKEQGQRHVRCPGCSAIVVKSYGCNKMRCNVCDTTFCFLCGKAISGYDHFNLENGDVTCRGQLFDMADLVDFVHQRAFQRRGPAVPRVERDWNAPQQFCIRCGQLANKVANNNHMRCAACHTAWCYLCRHELRGRGAAARHFGPSKCHQHTPG